MLSHYNLLRGYPKPHLFEIMLEDCKILLQCCHLFSQLSLPLASCFKLRLQCPLFCFQSLHQATLMFQLPLKLIYLLD